MEHYDSPQIINLGCGENITIKELACLVARKASFEGAIHWDRSKPDGMLRKCLDVSKMKAVGYIPKITLEEGVQKTIEEYKQIKIKTKQRESL